MYMTIFFNMCMQEYKDYLLLKDKMDSIQAEVSLLSEQLNSLPHNSPEVRVSWNYMYITVLAHC